MLGKRLIETMAMLMIGDSVLAILSPRRHVGLWSSGPSWWERMCAPLAKRPTLTRALGTLGLVAGIWLAWHEEPPAPESHPTEKHNGRPWAKRLANAMR